MKSTLKKHVVMMPSSVRLFVFLVLFFFLFAATSSTCAHHVVLCVTQLQRSCVVCDANFIVPIIFWFRWQVRTLHSASPLKRNHGTRSSLRESALAYDLQPCVTHCHTAHDFIFLFFRFLKTVTDALSFYFSCRAPSRGGVKGLEVVSRWS